MNITVLKHDYVPASGKQYDVRFSEGSSQRYVELTRDELRELHEATGHVLHREPKTRTTLAGTTTYDYGFRETQPDDEPTEPQLPLSWHAAFRG